MEDGDCIVPVDVSSAPHALADVTPGCRLRIRATCVLETKDGGANIAFPQIQGFTAVVNADEDEELKNCLWDLRSETLEEPSLQKAIIKTLQPYITDAQLAVRFHVAREKLSDNTVHALLCVIRELVVNARHHGQAAHVRVAGCLDGQRLRCAVSDDGCGFDPDAAPGVLQGHFGLQGIRERIEELRGALTIRSAPGKGARVCLRNSRPPSVPSRRGNATFRKKFSASSATTRPCRRSRRASGKSSKPWPTG